MLQSFVPLFMMTFFICLFIVLMQFLWRYIDELVGKGLGVGVIGELFFYAALTMIPMALPLAILLASLMTFGNLGERLELTAMKASGISLLRTMAPLIVLMVLVATGAFFFQNNVLPVAQTKMWTLLFSMRQKSPELEIPEGVFYDGIPGYNIFVQEKGRDNGMLYDLMIYDVSRGFENSSVILADSGKMSITPDRSHLFLKLWNGESFENLKDAGAGNMRNVPYRRESFDLKEIMVRFDSNFNRLDEQGMRNQYVGKNMAELKETIDSLSREVDSIGTVHGRSLISYPYAGVHSGSEGELTSGQSRIANSLPQSRAQKAAPVKVSREKAEAINIDSVFHGRSSDMQLQYLNTAKERAERVRQEYEFKNLELADKQKSLRRHAIERQKKFTLSFACIIFFFIGAPLGAIIRKGGLGTPLVISVLLFIFYYIIDNAGYKMARDGKWDVVEGMWLSAAVLLPMGIFFTYKAVNDSAVFNKDMYVNFFRRFFGVSEVRSVEMKEVVMDEVVPAVAVDRLDRLCRDVEEFLRDNPAKPSYLYYWMKGYDRSAILKMREEMEADVDYLSNSRDKMIVLKLMDFPVIRVLWFQQPSRNIWLSRIMIALFPIGVPVWLYGCKSLADLRHELDNVIKVARDLRTMIKPA